MTNFYNMKKLILLIASTVAMSASAMSAGTAPVMHTRSESHPAMLKQKSVSPVTKTNAAIIETPAGKYIDNLYMSEFALYPRGFEIYQRMVSGKVSAIVEGDDGCIYVKNPIGVHVTDSWLKLEHTEGTTYVAKLPQAATAPWEYEGEQMCMNFDRLSLDEDEGYYYPSFGESELYFNYADGVLTSIGELGKDDDMPVMLGLTYDIYGPEEADEAWAWFGVNNITVKPVGVVVTQLPEGVESKKMVMTSTDSEVPVWVAVNGGNIYLRAGESFGYAVGEIAGGKAVFKSKQYIGISGNSHCYFYGGTSQFVEDEDYYDGGYTIYHTADDITFDYQTSGDILKSSQTLIINEGDLSFYAKNTYDKPVIREYVAVEGAPADPVITQFTAYDDFDEYGVIRFDLPTTTADGAEISKVDMYYNIFVKGNDEPYVFEPDVYGLLNAPMTDVPYDFSDGGYDFTVKGTAHTVVFYEDFAVLGVQSVNVAAGKEYKSAIVWSDGSDGVESVLVSDDNVCEYFNLQGIPVAHPAQGLYIRRQGNKVEKIMVR